MVHFLKMTLRMHAQACVFYRNASILRIVQKQPRNIFHQLGRQNSLLKIINRKIFSRLNLSFLSQCFLIRGIRNKLIMDLRLTFFFPMKGVSTCCSPEEQ